MKLEDSAMQIKVSDPKLLGDLLASLARARCPVEASGVDTVEVASPSALLTPEQARREIAFYLATWQIRHPGTHAEFVD
jgi:hypothetical protein